MGKSSRLKRERKEAGYKRERVSRHIRNFDVLGLGNKKTPRVGTIGEVPDKVFRFFKEESHANDFASGNVWVSTLQKCREYEDPLQGDPHEAIHVYKSGFLQGGGGDENFVRAARNAGISIGPGCHSATVINCSGIHRLEDAFVICTTKNFNPDNLSETFGNCCVEVHDVERFFQLITDAMIKVHSVNEAVCGSIIYRDRYHSGYDGAPGPIGFVKPADKYEPQKEFRLLWTVDSFQMLKPFLLNIPEIASVCRRIA